MPIHGVCFEGPEELRKAQRPTRVLVVDDEPDTVATLLALLAIDGIEAKGAYSARQALDTVRLWDPDVVLIDIGMPETSGWDLAQRIRAEGDGKRPVLVAITGQYNKASDRILGQISGFSHYLRKPCDPRVVMRLVGSLKESR